MAPQIASLADLAADNPYDVPGVRLVGIVLGLLLLFAAIRFMFGRRR
jgi:hypothetical protein